MPEYNGRKVSKDYMKAINKITNAIKALKFQEKKVKEMKTDTSHVEAFNRIVEIESSFEKYKNAVASMEDSDDFDFTDLDPPMEDIREIYITSMAILKIFTKDVVDQSVLNSTAHNRSHERRVKLPVISIPKFDGNYKEWTSFYDSFHSLIDQDPDMLDVDRMHYLKGLLTGTALRTISQLPVTEANYKIAWALLKERFHNKRVIVNACLETLLNQEKITKPSASALRNLIDVTKESLQCIETLDIAVDEWDAILVFIVQTKMHIEIRTEWEKHLGATTRIPKFDEIISFLEMQFRVLDTAESSIEFKSSNFTTKSHHTVKTNAVVTKSKQQQQRNECVLCSGPHYVFFCPTFERWSIEERKRFISERNLCQICLHRHDEPCRSKYRCRECNGPHNTKLHEVQQSTSTGIHAITSSTASINMVRHGNKLLATAIVKVQDRYGIKHLLRAFIDQGSDGAIISEHAAQLLSLPRKNDNSQLTGVDNISLGTSKGRVKFEVESIQDNSFKFNVDALIMRSVLSSRKYSLKSVDWQHLNGISLADPDFMNPSRIDLLFGVDIYALILTDGLRKGKPNEPIAQNSALGWLVFGSLSTENNFNIRVNSISLSDQLQRFWENESIPLKPMLSEEHEKCLNHFNKTFKRLANGKMMVSLPFAIDPSDSNFLGNSRFKAMQRFYQMEKKFRKDPEFHRRYKEDIQGYLNLGHMSPCNDSNNGYFLPHHGVVRESSTTTKQRTVYDGSAKSSNGYSLNDRLLNGPTIQPELFDIFLRWRSNKIAIVSDIEKMYRQILVAPEDRKYQKILWRFSENQPIKSYQLNTVTFGLKPSPFLAIKSTFALADAEKETYPIASKKMKTDMYVDDCLSGSDSRESTIQLITEFIEVGKKGDLLFRKWASNDETVLSNIPLEHRAIDPSFQINKHETVKTLGMAWSPKLDQIQFTLDMSNFYNGDTITKRKLLSDASKLFDPCGLLSPIIIKPKIMMQKVWKTGIDWDSQVNKEIQSEWTDYKNELPLIENIKLNRWLHTLPNSIKTLHGFSDSSEQAYAASIYIVQTSENVTTSTLLCSKTRVAPIEPTSIPRLELCGAVLLAVLMNKVAKNLKIPEDNVYLWTDSSAVWTWFQAHPSNWKSYVAHRVQEIHSYYPAKHWRHVRTHDNPADIASRGVFASQLVENSLWFSGPSWLVLEKKYWPKIELALPSGVNLEKNTKINIAVTQSTPCEMEFLLRFSNLTRLLRVTARILRLTHRFRKEKSELKSDYVTTIELQRAKFAWVKYIQSLYFSKEIAELQTNKVVSEKSSLKALNPKLNKNGILIVDGRLQYAQLPDKQRHPMILPANSHFTRLIINWAHITTLHGTIHLTLARTRQEYWILNARNKVKSFIHECVTCYRQKPKPMNQLMAPLPMIKSSPARAFAHCGLDFAGPIEIKSSERRNAPTIKGYICVFVCMVSKACHLELVGDLTTQKFIMALRRLIGRRGICHDIYCDCGTNFQGASHELPRLFLQATSTVAQEIAHLFASDGINFHFNPPSAPNWGGQWEAYVKLTKHHLRRMTTSKKLTFEEMSTLLVQIECCINSRPLCSITSDPNDLDPLTPAHLLIGEPLNVLPEPSLLSLNDYTLDRFQTIQKSFQLFWKRFFTEYLHTLHPRKKWTHKKEELQINDLVVIVDENTPPAKWLMGRVKSMHPSKDGLHRTATLLTKMGDCIRPIVKLCKLPVQSSSPEDVRDRTN